MVSLIAAETQANPLGMFLPLALMAGIFYFLLIRPQQKRSRAQKELANSVEVGDEVMTTAGIFGIVSDIDDDEGIVELEIAPGTRIRMVKQGISRRITEDEYEEPEEEDEHSS
jgi:preprotein translocase subunit YajC